MKKLLLPGLLVLLLLVDGLFNHFAIASSIGNGAYSVIENAGSALTQRAILDMTGPGVLCADDATNVRTVCTVSGGGGGGGGTNTQTTTYTSTSSDAGKLVLMNCSSSCSFEPYQSPGSTYVVSVESVGSTLATVNLGSVTFNGSATVPTLLNYQTLTMWSDGTNYWGKPVAAQGSNMTLTANPYNLNFASSGGGGGGGTSNRGVFISATTCNASFSGGVYFSTDVGLTGQCNGTSYQWYYSGYPVPNLPANTSFSWRNQGGATVNTNGIMDLAAPSSGSDEVRGQEISLPTTPFTIDACFTVQNYQANYVSFGGGLYESDGTKLLTWSPVVFTGGAPYLAVGEWNSVTSFSAFAFGGSQTALVAGGPYCLRWNDNGTNNNFYLSKNYGFSWTLIYSAGRTAWLTPTVIGWGIDPANSVAADLTLISWYQH